MLKKLLIASAVLSFTSSIAFASSMDYKGEKDANTDAQSSTINQTLSQPTSVGVPYVGIEVGGQHYAGGPNGVLGGLFAGYGAKFGAAQNFYLGAELGADVGSAFGTSYSVTASLIPGLMVYQNLMAYGRLGVAETNYKDWGNRHSDTSGKVGLGLQTNIARNIALRGEYDYNSGPYNNNEVSLGLVYQFA